MSNEPLNKKSDFQQVLDVITSRILQNTRIKESINIADLKIDDTGIDSLELTEMVMELEDLFAVTIDDTKLTGSTTIKELVDNITNQAIKDTNGS